VHTDGATELCEFDHIEVGGIGRGVDTIIAEGSALDVFIELFVGAIERSPEHLMDGVSAEGSEVLSYFVPTALAFGETKDATADCTIRLQDGPEVVGSHTFPVFRKWHNDIPPSNIERYENEREGELVAGEISTKAKAILAFEAIVEKTPVRAVGVDSDRGESLVWGC